MKYESTILKRLIDTYGVVGNPRYISEIIKEFIVRGKERFPELFTYQADWLEHIDEFGLNPSYTVSYTGQSIYAPNTLERPVKSAILSGQTLVNVRKTISTIASDLPEIRLGTSLMKANTKYSVFVTGVPSDRKWAIVPYVSYTNNQNATFVTSENLETQLKFYINLGNVMSVEEIERVNITIVEGDFPLTTHFEGMQSVQMPVLTTIGKNLLNPSWKKAYGKFYPFKLKKGTTLTLSTKDSIPSLGGNLLFTTISGREKWFAIDAGATKNTITLDEDIYQVNNILTGDIEYQLEIGSVATSYEPYQSNILTVNEEVELRGIGNVKDELNLITGELTQRIGEIVLDGSVEVGNGSLIGDTMRFSLTTPQYKIKPSSDGLCDKITYIRWNSEDVEHIRVDGSVPYGKFIVWIKTSRLSTSDTQGFKQWLSQNPLTVQYELAEPVIKTVDLTILDQNGQNVKQLMSFNGGTHFNTRSSEGSPLPTVSISVETDLEETLKMCSLEGNTM